MTDKDITQVLQYIVENGSGACDKCPVFPCGKIKDYEDNQCIRFIAENALDLINRQKAEIERLNKEVNLVSIQFQDLQERNEDERNEAVKEFSKSLIDKIHGGKISATDILDFTVDYLRSENNGNV